MEPLEEAMERLADSLRRIMLPLPGAAVSQVKIEVCCMNSVQFQV